MAESKLDIVCDNEGNFYAVMGDGSFERIEIETQQNATENQPATFTVPPKKKWEEKEIKSLLYVYKENKHHFTGTHMKNAKAWKLLYDKLKEKGFNCHDAIQCRNKFNNLKKLYARAKDNNNKTGAAPIFFAYMEMFDDIYGTDHWVHPIARAESSEYIPIPEPSNEMLDICDEADPDDVEPIPKKKKKTVAETVEKYLDAMSAYREKRDDERRDERLQRQQLQKDTLDAIKESTETYKEMMSKLLDKL